MAYPVVAGPECNGEKAVRRRARLIKDQHVMVFFKRGD